MFVRFLLFQSCRQQTWSSLEACVYLLEQTDRYLEDDDRKGPAIAIDMTMYLLLLQRRTGF